MICHIAEAIVNRGDRVLICLPTAAAIWEFLKNLEEPSSFGGVLVINNNSDLENNDTFGEASLEKRSHELYCCLRVWKSWMKELRQLLDLRGFCHACCPLPDECTLLHFSLESFLHRYDNFVGLLKGCLEVVKKLSIIYLPDCDASNANKLLDILCQLDHNLHNHELNSGTLKAAFDPLGVPDDGIAKKLNEAKIDCLQLIDTLVTSLKLPQLDSREEVDKFCIIHSRFIISTPECASQLHRVNMKPFQVLIVGHAGLIQESELLIPLNLPLLHVVLLGDHQRQQPVIKSKVYIMSILLELYYVLYEGFRIYW
jgi:senataxin